MTILIGLQNSRYISTSSRKTVVTLGSSDFRILNAVLFLMVVARVLEQFLSSDLMIRVWNILLDSSIEPSAVRKGIMWPMNLNFMLWYKQWDIFECFYLDENFCFELIIPLCKICDDEIVHLPRDLNGG